MKIKLNRRIIKVKPLQLNSISDQNEAIKRINRWNREERERELQAAISPLILHQISTSNAPWVRKWE